MVPHGMLMGAQSSQPAQVTRVNDLGLNHLLVDVDRRVEHDGPPLVERRGPIVRTRQDGALMTSTLRDVTPPIAKLPSASRTAKSREPEGPRNLTG